jgi:tetratricopeptide (TPR) repeat protein
MIAWSMPQPNIDAMIKMSKRHLKDNQYHMASSLLKQTLLEVEKRAPRNTRKRIEILLLLAEANHVMGEWVDALMYLDAVVQTTSEKHLLPITVEALITSGTILSKKAKWDVAMRKFEQAQNLSESIKQPALKARALVGLGVIHWRQGESEEAIILASRAMAMGREINDQKLMGAAMALMGSARFDVGDFLESIKANESALLHFKKAEDLLEMSRVLNNLGETYKVMGDYDRAIEHFNQGLEIIEETGVKRNIGYLLMNLAECHVRLRHEAEAKEYAKRANEVIKDQEDVYLQAYLNFVWALIHAREGKADAAEREFENALSKMMALGIPFDVGVFQLEYARSSLKRHKKEKAMRHYKEAVRCFKESGSTPMAESAIMELAEIT